MGSLRDQLKQHGLANKKDERRVRQEKHEHRKAVGDEGVAAEKRARDAELREQAERKKDEDRRRELDRRSDSEKEQAVRRVATLIRDERLDGASTAGNRKFYFVTREQTVSFLEFSPGTIQGIIDGRHAIVDAAGILPDDFAVVESTAAKELRELEPDRIRFWNEDGPPARARRR